MQKLRNVIHDLRQDERGSITFLSAALIIVAILVILPLVWNMGAIRTVRRQSQNSSDAAALAGAESVARQLNALSQDWWGCIPPETPPMIVGRYVQSVVRPIASSGTGQGAAQSYAAQNRGSVNTYSQHLHAMGADGVHAKLVDGVVVPPIHANVRGAAPVRGTLLEKIYDLDGTPIRSGASAEAYLDRVRTWQTPCPGNPKAIARHYQFRWKIRMVETGW